MATKYEEGKRYLITFTGKEWQDNPKYDEPQPAVFKNGRGYMFFEFTNEGWSHVSLHNPEGYEIEVTPLDEPTPTEPHYLYPDGTEFSVIYNVEQRGYVFHPDALTKLFERLGVKPAPLPKAYEDGLYVDKDGDEVLVYKGIIYTDGDSVQTYDDAYGPLTPKEDQ